MQSFWREAIELFERRLLFAAHVVGSPADFPTIQAAVDAAPAGGTVTVDPGTYAELVIVEKPLVLRGAQAGVDARTTTRGAETIVRGFDQGGGIRTSSFVIAADNVTLDGFTVQDQTSQGTYGAGIILAEDVSGTRILNNVIKQNIIGMTLANDDGSNGAVIEHNAFIENNRPGDGTGRGIYTDGSITGGNLDNVSINENLFLRNFGGLADHSREAAIDLHALTAASNQTNIRITNNIFDDNGKALLAFNADDLTITGNVVVSTRDTRSAALRFEGNIHNVTLSNNLISNNISRGIRIDNKSAPGPNYNFDITNNNIYGNANSTGQGVNRDGLYVDAGQFDDELNATNNWWGSASGPSGDGPGSGDAVFANGNDVAYIPWATAPNGNLQVPYFGEPIDAEARIDVVNFDHGGEGIAYHDADAVNRGGQGHLTDGVDVSRTSDPGSGYNIGYTKAGEWLEYTIDVESSGTYDLAVRVASAQATGGTFHLECDGVNVSGPITAPNTGGWQTWQTIKKSGVNLSAGKHVLRLAFDKDGNGGAIANFNWIGLTKTGTTPQPPPPTSNLPAPWNEQDIGTVGAAGSASANNGTFTVTGSGSDIWGNADSFHFVYQQVSGDGSFTVRVASQQSGDPLEKAGIMIRESLAANSKQAGLFIMPAAGVRFIRRLTTGGGSTSATVTTNTGITAPYWLRLTRSGTTLSAYRSPDGVNWTFVGFSQISMSQQVYVGLAVTSHQAGILKSATFDNLMIS